MLTFTSDPQVNVIRLSEVRPTICLSCFHNRKVEKKNFNQKPKHKISKSVTLNLRSLMWVRMVQHKRSDQYLTSGKVSTRFIQRFVRYMLLKTLTKNFNILQRRRRCRSRRRRRGDCYSSTCSFVQASWNGRCLRTHIFCECKWKRGWFDLMFEIWHTYQSLACETAINNESP